MLERGAPLTLTRRAPTCRAVVVAVEGVPCSQGAHVALCIASVSRVGTNQSSAPSSTHLQNSTAAAQMGGHAEQYGVGSCGKLQLFLSTMQYNMSTT